MANTAEDFNIDYFQKQVLREIHDIEEHYSAQALLNHYSSNNYLDSKINKPLFHESSLLSQRRRIYREIESELGVPSIFINKRKLILLLSKLKEDDGEILERINDEYHDISNSIREQYQQNFLDFKSAIEREEYEIRALKNSAEKEQAKEDALEILSRKDIRKHLCPVLHSVSNDVNDIAKAITPILIPLILAGTIVIPLQPVLFAYIAIIVARMGIAGICGNYDKEKARKST